MTQTLSLTRKFDGKVYQLSYCYATKADAEQVKKHLKSLGGKVRIVRTNAPLGGHQPYPYRIDNNYSGKKYSLGQYYYALYWRGKR